jgi:hypothetical protein
MLPWPPGATTSKQSSKWPYEYQPRLFGVAHQCDGLAPGFAGGFLLDGHVRRALPWNDPPAKPGAIRAAGIGDEV